MGPVVHSISANSCDSVGVRQSTALLGGTQPERALVFVERGREENRGGRGTGTMIYTHTLNAVGAASAVRPTDGWGQEAATDPRRGIATWA